MDPQTMAVLGFVIEWLLYLSLLPVTFFWLRRVWRIIVRRDFSEVGLKKGLPPKNPEKFAPFTAIINLVGGIVMLTVIITVPSGKLDFQSWTAVAGITLWCKFFLDFILSRHAHPMTFGRKRATEKAEDEKGAADQPAADAVAQNEEPAARK